jgi:ATP-binding cassette subfamily B protein
VSGDRVLLQGSSGAGKSTLAALLAGLRSPTGGLLLLHGLDRPTLGSASWRRAVVLAPQYHENHVLLGSLAFNLFLGKRWPPTADDLAEADALCRELGLGELLDRMPGGLFQMVGETGWQLSQGERSRVFIARAILQRADLIVLDESLAALDPVTLERSLRVVCRSAASLVLIHHC